MGGKIKLFGAALDALDDPERVALKRAWIDALQAGRVPPNMPRDPYDAIALPLIEEFPDIFEPAGKIDMPSWLTPCPLPEDQDKVTRGNFIDTMDAQVGRKIMAKCRQFVEKSILPAISGLFAVDHCLAAGNFLECCEAHGSDSTSLIVLDSHFDAIPTHLRIPTELKGIAFPETAEETLHCGNFIGMMIENRGVPPKNVIIIGPSDYPPVEKPGDDDAVNEFREAYLSFMDKGVKLMPKSRVRSKSFAKDFEKLLDGIKTPYVYVSLDADVGSCACMNAVRFMDTVGLDEETIVGIARAIARRIKKGQFSLAGFDVAEVDVHLLGLEGPDGAPDRTAEVCARFVKTLVGCE